jgi:2,3-diphosphopglycerate-independent phosphoglycerate mutase
VESRRADRHFEHLGPTLCAFLTGIPLPSFPQHRVDVQYATEHRCGVRVRGPGLTDSISSTDPLKDFLPLLTAAPTDDTKEAEMTAKLVNELSLQIHKALETHPINEERRKQGKAVANVVLLRGCGTLIEAPTFINRHQLKPFLIAPTCIIAGLAMSLGFDIVKAPGGTGDYHTNLKSKGQTLVDTFLKDGSDYTFGFIHVKGNSSLPKQRYVCCAERFIFQLWMTRVMIEMLD